MTHAPAGYRHGLRVRMGGPNGPRGVLLECESRKSGRMYWRVRLQDSGDWVWPDALGGIVVDGTGTAVTICQSCGLRFVHHVNDGELICGRCDAEQFGTAVRTSEPPPTKRFRDGRDHRRWIPDKRRRR